MAEAAGDPRPGVVVMMPTAPRLQQGAPAGYLTRSVGRLLEVLPERVPIHLFAACDHPADHAELAELATHARLRQMRRSLPSGAETVAPAPDRIRRDGATLARWSLQQSLDFLDSLEQLRQKLTSSPGTRWILRIEDDAWVCDGFLEHLNRACARHAERPYLSLFSIRLRWDGMVLPHYTGAVALAFRVSALEGLLQSVRDQLADLPFDVALANYRTQAGLRGCEVFPSLVQHFGALRSDPSLEGGELWTSPSFRQARGPIRDLLAQIPVSWRVLRQQWKRRGGGG